MSIIENLKEAIENKSWIRVGEVYEQLTGQILTIKEDETDDLKDKVRQLASELGLIENKKKESPQKKKITKVVDTTQQSEMDYDALLKGIKSSPAGEVKARKPVMIGGPIDEKEQEIAQRVAERAKSMKMPKAKYVPDMIECDGCKKSFDYNKVYPAGQLEKMKPICHECRLKRR